MFNKLLCLTIVLSSQFSTCYERVNGGELENILKLCLWLPWFPRRYCHVTIAAHLLGSYR